MQQRLICPLGSECEGIKNNEAFRCRWFVEIAGKHPQTGADVMEWRCAMEWMPILMIELAQTNRGQTAAIESFRNETVKGQTDFNNLLQIGLNERILR